MVNVNFSCDACSITSCEFDVHEFIMDACVRFAGCSDYRLIDGEIARAQRTNNRIDENFLKRFKEDWTPLNGYLGDYACQVFIHAKKLYGEQLLKSSTEKLGLNDSDAGESIDLVTEMVIDEDANLSEKSDKPLVTNSSGSFFWPLTLPSSKLLNSFFGNTLVKAVERALMVHNQASNNSTKWIRYVLFIEYCGGKSLEQLAKDYKLPDAGWLRNKLDDVAGRLREVKAAEYIDPKIRIAEHIYRNGSLPKIPKNLALQCISRRINKYSGVLALLLEVSSGVSNTKHSELKPCGQFGREVHILKSVVAILECRVTSSNTLPLMKKKTVNALAAALKWLIDTETVKRSNVNQQLPISLAAVEAKEIVYSSIYEESGRYEYLLFMRCKDLVCQPTASNGGQRMKNVIDEILSFSPSTSVSKFRRDWLGGCL